MEISYWISRWNKNKIGFHLNEAHWALSGVFSDYLDGVQNICLPLCGKTPDLIWLAKKGLHVTGIEVSEKACLEFFNEHKLAYFEEKIGSFVVRRSGNIKVITGDFFKVHAILKDKFDAIYDRGALVAMPPEKRKLYAQTSVNLLKPDGKLFLVSFNYPQDEMGGPPFSVPEDEIAQIYPQMNVKKMSSVDILANLSKFRERGLSKMHENGYLLLNNSN